MLESHHVQKGSKPTDGVLTHRHACIVGAHDQKPHDQKSSESFVTSEDKKCSNWNTGTAHRDNDLRATVCLCTLKRCASDVTAPGRDPHARWLLPLGAAVAVLTVFRSRISPITRWSSSTDKAKAAMPPTSKRHPSSLVRQW